MIFITPILVLVHQGRRKAHKQYGRLVEGGPNYRTNIIRRNKPSHIIAHDTGALSTIYIAIKPCMVIIHPKWYRTNICFQDTVKPVFKGHSDQGTPCDQGTLSHNRVLSAPMLKNLWWRDTCHVGTLSLGYWGVPWRQVLLYTVLITLQLRTQFGVIQYLLEVFKVWHLAVNCWPILKQF